jgi:hypothetical protein
MGLSIGINNNTRTNIINQPEVCREPKPSQR